MPSIEAVTTTLTGDFSYDIKIVVYIAPIMIFVNHSSIINKYLFNIFILSPSSSFMSQL